MRALNVVMSSSIKAFGYGGSSSSFLKNNELSSLKGRYKDVDFFSVWFFFFWLKFF
jgi:hypothetical protein